MYFRAEHLSPCVPKPRERNRCPIHYERIDGEGVRYGPQALIDPRSTGPAIGQESARSWACINVDWMLQMAGIAVDSVHGPRPGPLSFA